MLDVDSLLPITANAESYEKRCHRMVQLLANQPWTTPKGEVKRFKRIMRRLKDDFDKTGVPSTAFGQAQTKIAKTMHNVVEFVLTYAESDYRGFGYLTQGKPSLTLPLSLRNLLASTFKICLTEGGTRENAELLADIFATAFPNLELLESHSPMAQGMLLGCVPQRDALDLKLYFNTRLGVGAPHRQRVLSIFERLNIDASNYYDRIYEESSSAAFHGLGIDLFGTRPPRLKVYVRIPKDKIESELRRVLVDFPESKVEASIAQCAALIEKLEDPLLADDIELALSFSSDGSITLKCTAFFVTEDSMEHDPGAKVSGYLQALGYDTKLLKKVVAAGEKGVEKAVVETHPYHGVGIEIGSGRAPKVNIYLRPLI